MNLERDDGKIRKRHLSDVKILKKRPAYLKNSGQKTRWTDREEIDVDINVCGPPIPAVAAAAPAVAAVAAAAPAVAAAPAPEVAAAPGGAAAPAVAAEVLPGRAAAPAVEEEAEAGPDRGEGGADNFELNAAVEVVPEVVPQVQVVPPPQPPPLPPPPPPGTGNAVLLMQQWENERRNRDQPPLVVVHEVAEEQMEEQEQPMPLITRSGRISRRPERYGEASEEEERGDTSLDLSMVLGEAEDRMEEARIPSTNTSNNSLSWDSYEEPPEYQVPHGMDVVLMEDENVFMEENVPRRFSMEVLFPPVRTTPRLSPRQRRRRRSEARYATVLRKYSL